MISFSTVKLSKIHEKKGNKLVKTSDEFDISLTVTKKKLGLEQFPWIRTIFRFLDPN
jgi:hypothetical protein